MKEYFDVDDDDAKMAIGRIFSLGLPQSDLPFLWSLAVDVAQAKQIVLERPEFESLLTLFGDRSFPTATRLFYALSPTEDDLLHQMQDTCTAQGWGIVAYIFDELVFETVQPACMVEEAFENLEDRYRTERWGPN